MKILLEIGLVRSGYENSCKGGEWLVGTVRSLEKLVATIQNNNLKISVIGKINWRDGNNTEFNVSSSMF